MYARFFGLRQEPFSLAPDPRYLFMSRRHREALAHLLYGIGGSGGFVLLSGEIGAGKTTVCRCLLEQIPKKCNVAYVFNPKLTVVELLKTVCEEFRIPTPAEPTHGPATVKTYVDPLNAFLLRTHAIGQNNVLIIDEAQMLSVDVLEQLRLLTNLETSERKLLQIVLIGQPELRTMLERPELEQLAQRVIARFHLKALSEAETLQYIKHRLSVAGLKRAMPFDKKALQRIHQIARGVPRRINLLADRALLGAYAHGKQTVDAAIVERAAREVFGKSEAGAFRASRPGDQAPSARRRIAAAGRGWRGPVPMWATGALLLALLVGAGYAGWRQWGGDSAAPLAARAASGSASAAGSAPSPVAATGGSRPPAGGPSTAIAVPILAKPPGAAVAASSATPSAGTGAASAAVARAPAASASPTLLPTAQTR
jgi:general secretion pathway protein A